MQLSQLPLSVKYSNEEQFFATHVLPVEVSGKYPVGQSSHAEGSITLSYSEQSCVTHVLPVSSGALYLSEQFTHAPEAARVEYAVHVLLVQTLLL